MLDGHLEDLGLFQLCRGRFFQCGGDESLELVEAAVDPVPPPLLDDAPPPLAGGPAAAGRGGHDGAAGDGAHVLGEGVVVATVAVVVVGRARALHVVAAVVVHGEV